MKYLIKITTRQSDKDYEFRFTAGNIVTASQFIADTHRNYHANDCQVGRDYNITLLTDEVVQPDFDNNEVGVLRTLPILVKVTD